MRTNRGFLFRACSSKRVSYHHFCLVETERQARQWESFIVDRKEYLLECSDWGHWHGIDGVTKNKLTRSGISHVIDLESIFNFLWFLLNWKQGQKIGKLTVIDQLITIWGQLLKRLWLAPCEVVGCGSTDYIWTGHCLFITQFLRSIQGCLSEQAVPGCRVNLSTRHSRSYVKGPW